MKYLSNDNDDSIKDAKSSLPYLQIGEDGRNRTGKKIAIRHPEMVEVWSRGMALYRRTAFNVSVNAPKLGRPGNVSLVPEKAGDESGYVLNLVADGGYHRGRNDRISVLTTDLPMINILAQGQGRDGIAGNIGRWSQVLLTAPEGILFKLSLDRSTRYLQVLNGEILKFSTQDAELHSLPIEQEFTSLSL